MKVSLFSKYVWSLFGKIAAWTLAIFSIIIAFLPNLYENRFCVIGIMVISHIMLYILLWLCLNAKRKVSFKINGTKIIVKEGDIFKEQGKKIIAFNEYFDTTVDDKIIAKGSLNGIFIEEHADKEELEKQIDLHLKNLRSPFTDKKRAGKQCKYKLGTIVPYDDFFLLAYSRFSENNCAYLNKDDIAKVYTNMWEEIDKYKACNSLCFPVLGSSKLVRMINYTPQQLVELFLWSFRLSGVKLERSATLTVVVHKSMVNEINFIKLKDYSD